VDVREKTVGAIGPGLLVLAGAEEGDAERDADYLADKVAALRIFEDADEKMNLSVKDVGGAILLVSQFTLLGDARHGKRPSFSHAARPERAEPLIERMRRALEAQGIAVETGVFRADMQVRLVNDGPVTILLDSRKNF
jgi:D-tyrosyl-tRNA(Tyr) deacylase